MNPLRGLALALPLAIAAEGRALPLLSEVFYDAVGTDDGQLFVELYGTPGTDLSGFAIEGVNGADGAVTHSLALTGTIPADGIFVVADAASGGGTAVAGADLLLDFDFQNGPDSIVLRMGPTVLDALGYGVFGPADVFAGEGQAAPDPAAGSSLARLFADVDSGDNLADFTVLAAPTPGSAPLLGVPEPGCAALVAAALGAAARRRRAR
jgi:hypothetical protein